MLRGFDMTRECAVTKRMWVLAHASDFGGVRRMKDTNDRGAFTLPEGMTTDQMVAIGIAAERGEESSVLCIL